MEGEIFSAFFNPWNFVYNGVRRIFDKRANYVERFVKIREIANFKVENVPLHQFISKSLRWRVKYFGAFLILGTMSTMVSRRIFDKRANYVERFVKSFGI